MSELKTEPIVSCCICGKPVKVMHLETATSDVNGDKLFDLFSRIARSALCDYHMGMKYWYYSQGRADEWEKGMIRNG